MRPVIVTAVLCVSLNAMAAPPAAPALNTKADECPITEARLAQVTGQKVTRREVQKSMWQTTQCVFTLENGTVQFMVLPPEAKKKKTHDELAAVFAEEDAHRKLKDFSVPAYSFSGGVNLVMPTVVWQVLVHRGPGPALDPMKIARALTP